MQISKTSFDRFYKKSFFHIQIEPILRLFIEKEHIIGIILHTRTDCGPKQQGKWPEKHVTSPVCIYLAGRSCVEYISITVNFILYYNTLSLIEIKVCHNSDRGVKETETIKLWVSHLYLIVRQKERTFIVNDLLIRELSPFQACSSTMDSSCFSNNTLISTTPPSMVLKLVTLASYKSSEKHFKQSFALPA